MDSAVVGIHGAPALPMVDSSLEGLLPAARKAAPLVALGLLLTSLRCTNAVGFLWAGAGMTPSSSTAKAKSVTLMHRAPPAPSAPSLRLHAIRRSATPLAASRLAPAEVPRHPVRFPLKSLWQPTLLMIGAALSLVCVLRHRTASNCGQRSSIHAMAAVNAKQDDNDAYDLPFMTLEGDGIPRTIDQGRVPIKVYTKEIEPDCYQQLLDLANSPVPVGHVSCMPDVHLGKGATIGSVFASEHYVAPMAVGVDIGCGMIAAPVTDLFQDDPKLEHRRLVELQKAIKAQVPTGNGPEGNRKMPVDRWAEILEQITAEHPPTAYLREPLRQDVVGKQMGTLGGGNHFIEVLRNEKDGQVWLMVHSGSRRIGNETASHYDRLAKQQMKKHGRKVYGQLHYLDTDSEEGQAYLQDMAWCQGYALHNRLTMMHALADVVAEMTGHTADLSRVINVHHNYCVCEQCTFFNYTTKQMETKRLWVTRKGATSAKAGEFGIIPGSMGVGSYIVRGRGNPDSWQSCSHGAGRKMSRTKAKKVIEQSRFEHTLEGVVCDSSPSLRDEAPDAYKDLTTVMQNQESLVEVVHRLLPMVNVKGF